MIDPNLSIARVTSVFIAICLCSTSAISWACCSLAPAQFRQTKGLAAEVLKDGHIVHLLGYQNSVVNGAMVSLPHPVFSATFKAPAATFKANTSNATILPIPAVAGSMAQRTVTGTSSSGNAMILPIPAVTGSMSQKNILDTSSCPNFLDDLDRALVPQLPANYPVPIYRSLGSAARPAPVIFDHDIYTIVLSQDAEQIPKVLQRVKLERRPNLNPAIFSAYKKWYPGWTFALCCFNNKEEAKAKPMLWWYSPRNPDKLFFPALDAHDGAPPNLAGFVDVDHSLMVSSHLWNSHCPHDGRVPPQPVPKALPTTEDTYAFSKYQNYFVEHPSPKPAKYSDKAISPTVKSLLPKFIMGKQYHEQMKQGDFFLNVQDVRKGTFNMQRDLPPGASKS